jgi:hypothetical protein
MTKTGKPSIALRLLAAACSFVALAVILVLLLRWQVPHTEGMLATIGVCFVASAAFGFFQPSGGWTLGLWTSAGYWLYLGGVSIALMLNSQFEWTPVMEAIVVLAAGGAGAFLGGKLNGFGGKAGQPIH